PASRPASTAATGSRGIEQPPAVSCRIWTWNARILTLAGFCSSLPHFCKTALAVSGKPWPGNSRGEFAMRRFTAVVFVLAWMLLLPALASAQATVSGVVQDASGGVLPGVTVEASSPVLIEKARTAVTDGNGRFQIVDLRPGLYRVTFTLTGFSTVVRDGIELTGSSVARIEAELRVGAVQESVTVTGEAPTVDVQTVTRQRVLSAEMIDALPTARN